MIKTTTKNLSLVGHVPRRGKRRNLLEVPTATLFILQGRIQFSRYAIDEMKMEGETIRFFYENKDPTIIGWKVLKSPTPEEEKKEYKCRIHNNGVWRVSINKLIHEVMRASKGNRVWGIIYRNVPIEKYTKDGETYYFVSLKSIYKE